MSVNVCVITYNHGKYISKCLSSMVSQKTNFDFKIIIRDDCSTDDTLEIINDFKDKYPDLIEVLDSSENVGGAENSRLVFNAACLDYISWCEGDDFFIDNFKLQKQFDYLEANKNIDFCVHPSLVLSMKKEEISFLKEGKYFTQQDILDTKGQFSASSSYFFRTKVIKQLPSWFSDAPIGDLFLELYALKFNKGGYLPEVMSAYREFSIGSWRDEIRQKKYQQKIEQYHNIIKYIGLSKKDFNSDLDFNFKMSEIYYSLANLYIKSNKLHDFSIYINKAIVLNKTPSLFRRITFLLSRHPYIYSKLIQLWMLMQNIKM